MGQLAFPYTLTDIQERLGVAIDPATLVVQASAAFWPDLTANDKPLMILARSNDGMLSRFQGELQPFDDEYVVMRCPTTHANSRTLREVLPWFQPTPLGLQTSAGFGDRLGLATPGHVQSLLRVLREFPGRTIVPIFAQQSIREMERTSRSPEDVLSDATWGAFQAGWRGNLGADADHLKTTQDIDACAAVGFSFFTIDPGAYVDSAADHDAPEVLTRKLEALPWQALQSSLAELRQRVGQQVELDDRTIELTEAAWLRAAVKYGRAVAHVASMYRHLAAKDIPFELEVSVDETETPTTHVEHIYVASELSRLGVRWVSLAPRYVGSFEKGVDYIGDLTALEADLAGHAAIARTLGPYKLSLHSGSDKFSVYPLINAATNGMVHLKTAGTSYLEGLRVLAVHEPALFREILELGRERYETDRATYHVSAELARLPANADLADEQLVTLLDQFDARQILHVTFGSALARFGTEIKAGLQQHATAYAAGLDTHFYRHLAPFCGADNR